MIVPGALATINIDDDKETSLSKRLGKTMCGVVIIGGVVGVALEVATVVLRFVNVGFINMKIKYFLLAVSHLVLQ